MQKVDRCEMRKEAEETMKLYKLTQRHVKRTGFCCIRDHIITNLVLDNSSRPGAIANMTLQEYGLTTRQKDGHIVAIMKHKTDYAGPAYLCFPHELKDFTDNYIRFARNQLPGISKEHCICQLVWF